ncbi:2-succinyl-6-hydroxy-2,4-cyclohexadiene-1-carboxylate synthase [Scopulibacillus darangshiensis]|uniref:Putative 2-succinyl-6-hydroxy-2,4-cyclohexadiene-1-carboxylate synthase n=1 Tax=Scopulibacillus darangshiensis TaxID=442528 RepID=A0A4R2P4U6_9BACL|nr:2-succinyl-6-hydroxy-2,4-cyclohexadiene-1-carboxylate synthase [Scopulibacillus darangshiensis]TCP29840.1 2-succinyl-6-hydroxy-2,4-cyclohexadiene-1-carboxylate synthase [Scopulibacillus darangshiensis]
MMINLIETLGVNRSVHVAGDGPPLLMLHGFTGTMATWEPFIQKWSKRYKIIAVDIVGHGQTTAPNHISYYTMEHEASALIECLDVLAIEKVNILGYSMGGRLALYMKVHHPERVGNLILESSSPGLIESSERKERKNRDDALADRIMTKGLEAFVDDWEQLPLFATQKNLPLDKRQAIRTERMGQTAEGLANSLRGMGTGIQPSLWNDLSSISDKVYFIAGHLDQKFLDIGKRMVNRAPDGKLNVITQTGHAVHVEQPEIFDKIVYDDFYHLLTDG